MSHTCVVLLSMRSTAYVWARCILVLCIARGVDGAPGSHVGRGTNWRVGWRTPKLLRAPSKPMSRSRRAASCPHYAPAAKIGTRLLIRSCEHFTRTNTVRNAPVSVTRAVTSRRSRPLALTSYLYCFILNHAQLGRDLHHTRWNRFMSVRALAHLIVNNCP